MNTELYKAGVYGKLDNKNVTAWLDLQNKAAHAQYYRVHRHPGRPLTFAGGRLRRPCRHVILA